MKSLFSHFLITRYNVLLEGWEYDKSGTSTRDHAWLEHRFQLFTRFCLPSVANQSEKNFTWLIYCDTKTPSLHFTKLLEATDPLLNVKIRLTDGYHECLADIDSYMTQCESAFVITSRLDNDDGLGLDFIKTVQDNFVEENGVILNLLHGHGYNVVEKIATKLINIRNNHFTSLIEMRKPEGGHTSIRGFQHGAPPKEFVVRDIESQNSWLKIFHERNLKSQAFGYPLFHQKFDVWYGVKNAPLSAAKTLRYLIWWLGDGVKRKTSKK